TRTAAPPTSTLSLHDALPISVYYVEQTAPPGAAVAWVSGDSTKGALNEDEGIHFAWHLKHRGRPDVRVKLVDEAGQLVKRVEQLDRKSTRLNSSHVKISYAVF